MVSLKDSDRHIVDSIGKLLDGAGGLKRVRRLQSTPLGLDRELWAQLASLGWLGAAVPEAQGGVGLAPTEIALLAEHAGERLMPEPLVPALAGSRLLARCKAAPAATLLADVIAGKKICMPVGSEETPGAGTPLAADGAGRVTGRTAYALDAHHGDVFLLPIAAGGALRIGALARDAKGLTLESEETVDGGSITRLRLDGIAGDAVTILHEGADTAAIVAEAEDLARLGYAALLTGLMDEALQMTVAYLKVRRQFGIPIGAFQALQHRAASLYVVIKASRALLYEACKAGPARRSVAALGAKAYAAQSAMQTVKECVQLHGAIGYTEEHDMSLFFRRAMSLAVAGGDAASCRKLLYAERQKIRAI